MMIKDGYLNGYKNKYDNIKLYFFLSQEMQKLQPCIKTYSRCKFE